LGIAPRAAMLSRATSVKNLADVFVIEEGKIVGAKTRKLNVDFSSWTECADPQVRFMIMEKVGDSVEKTLDKRPKGVGLVGALETGAKMIELIEKLHKAGIVHRDVHAGNFAKGIRGNSLYLIDYGLSGHASSINSDGIESPWFERLERSPLAVFHHHLSPWEMMGYLSSYRDDFVRTLSLIGAMMYGHDDYMEGNHEVTKVSIEQAEMSMFGKKPKTRFSIMNRKIHNILSGKGTETPLTLVQEECGGTSVAINKMRELLDALVKINMKLDVSIYAVPNYSRIAKLLKETALVVRQCNVAFLPIV
jgi:tRNA A-37 threonylcarbamoyl transferase component Bud32